MKQILLHACCATCAGYCLERLIDGGYRPVVYFSNPNIYPEVEFEKRYLELKSYCEGLEVEIHLDEYRPEEFYYVAAGFESEPERGMRCLRCFELRLSDSAKFAKAMNIPLFTTTLTVSPHKNSKNIIEIGEAQAKVVGVEFLALDFKKQNGFLRTMQIAKRENFYRQNYCGCEFSIRDKEESSESGK